MAKYGKLSVFPHIIEAAHKEKDLVSDFEHWFMMLSCNDMRGSSRKFGHLQIKA